MHVVTRARRRVMAAMVTIAALVATLLIVGAPTATATYPGAEGKIAFMQYGDQLLSDGRTPTEIWTVNPDGSQATRLTAESTTLQPVISPSGDKIAYVGHTPGARYQLYVMNIDGTGTRQVSNLTSCCPNFPSWSADGETIALVHGSSSIAAIDVATGAMRTLVTTSGNVVIGEASYAPDGSYLVWTEWIDNQVNGANIPSARLVRGNVDGTGRTVLHELDPSTGRSFSTYLRWYPDSDRVAWGYTRMTGAMTYDQHHLSVGMQGDVLSDIVNNNVAKVIPSPTGERLLADVLTGNQRDYFFVTPALEIISKLPIDMAHSPIVWSWQALNAVEPTPDTTQPTVSITSPTQGREVVQGSGLIADYSCADESGGSGLASCFGSVASGAAIDTSVVGDKTFTVTARDNAGNETVKTVNYRVVWPFGNFTGPVDPLPTLNSGKAGGVVPVKFSLGGNRGLNILVAGYPKSAPIVCDGTAPVDVIETSTLSPGSNVLSYDSATDQYGYNWKTDKAWKGTCRQLTFMLADGATYKANFKFS